MTELSATTTTDLPGSIAQPPFEPNIDGVVARLQLSGGSVLFCDVLLITQRDLVVTVPESATVPRRGETARCSLFLTDDDSFVAHREGMVHWEMVAQGQQLAGLFLNDQSPSELLDLTHDDRRREVRFPANNSCTINDNKEALPGRLVNYSLNGLATQLGSPMTIGNRYTIEVESAEGPIQLDGICRWNIETSYGFVNGCSIRLGDGQLLARRAVCSGGDPIPDRKNASNSRLPSRIRNYNRSEPAGNQPPRRPVLTNTTIVVLSAVLLGLSLRTTGEVSDVALLSGCLGLVAYLGLGWATRRKAGAEQRGSSDANANRTTAESRLAAHLAGRVALPMDKDTTADAKPAETENAAHTEGQAQ